MYQWTWELWLFQAAGLILLGGGLVAGGLFLANRTKSRNASDRVGVPGGLPNGPGINIAHVRIGGDVAGLLIVVGIILAFLPYLWGWFLGVAVGAVVVAVGLFLWHRYHPW